MTRVASTLAILLACTATTMWAEESGDLMELTRSTHIHSLAFDPQKEDRVLLATHHGLHALDLVTGEVALLGESRQDFMGFSVGTEGRFFASGHPEAGGNSGVLTSTDEGASWSKLSDGVGGPVDFHQMTVSPADPATLYGAYNGDLQHSHDGGSTWELVGPAPDKLIDLAASATNPSILYAATEAGLLKSEDNGQTWAPAHSSQVPATFVETGPGGMLHAFILGPGLVRASEGDLDWEVVSEPVGGEYILHYATDGTRAVAATGSGALLFSENGGESWQLLGG